MCQFNCVRCSQIKIMLLISVITNGFAKYAKIHFSKHNRTYRRTMNGIQTQCRLNVSVGSSKCVACICSVCMHHTNNSLSKSRN